jgi:methylated-DNA-[protein]-cysteine S-methyltransferase
MLSRIGKRMPLQRITLPTPLGPMVALWGPKGLVSMCLAPRIDAMERHLKRHLGSYEHRTVARLSALQTAMDRYSAGQADALIAVPVDPPGTAFQRTVWAALRQIPAGTTWSYGQLAQHIGKPRAFRAVAQANGANPVSLVIPCHRVIGSDGQLGGFTGELEHKRWLLTHEGSWPAQRQTYLWKSMDESEKPR